MKTLTAVSISVVLGCCLTMSSRASQQPQTAAANPAAPYRAMLDQYCVTCHNERAKTAGLMLDKMDLDHVAENAETWEKVIRKLRGGMMPPNGRPRPANENVYGLVSFLESSLDRAGMAKPNPGRATIHRLNRTEYGNAIRDLLALETDVAELLPADDESNGFDNIADVLKLSPTLLEQYLSASRKISSLAVGNPATPVVTQRYAIAPDISQEDHIEGLPLGTRGGMVVRTNFPLDGQYDFRVFLLRNIVGYMKGLEWPHQLEIAIDGERVFLAPVGGEDDNKMSDANFAAAADTIDARLKSRISVKAGPHSVSVAFIRKNSAEYDEPLDTHTRDHDLQNMNGIPLIERMDISGPYEPTGPGDTPSRRRIFTCRPAGTGGAAEETACAKKIVSTLARRAYRQPVSEADVDLLMGFYQSGRKNGNFEAGVENALAFLLTAPKFLFRTEFDPANATPGNVYKVSDLDLASRLSFFIWSSIPDDELLNVASQGKLKDPVVLEQQVKRMLADKKSDALVRNFAGQWLFLRNLQSTHPDGHEFPNFDDNLRQAFRRETELFFDSILRENRSVLDLLNANYTFVNGRLAKHYGIPNVYGSQFRRVTLKDQNRMGLLGQGSVLTVTSYPNRTSPVLRGKWILENILGTPPPPPPATVPPLKENDETSKPRSVRELMEEHRKSPACSGCHSVMDPLGFSLENFDGVGEWRTKDQSGPINASGQLADGTKVEGPVTLRQALNKHPEQFAGTVTEKLLTYALGRGLEAYDMPVVRGIVKDASRNEYKFSSLIMGIVKSAPFQMRKAQEQQSN